MTGQTQTDTQALEALFTDTPAVCHIFRGPYADRALCGVPRAEQARHAVWHAEECYQHNYCPVCGLPRCPACRAEGR